MAAPAILAGLNQAQQAAVTSSASVVQILAPPGSGKTKTLTSRVSHLLQHNGYKPWNVICLTFTVKSAREMKERIAKLVGNGLESKIILGTFHSVCLRYLRQHGHLIGLRKGFSIADASDSKAIITRIIKQLKISTVDPQAARSRISSCKAKSLGYDELRKTGKKRKVDEEEFVTIFEAYENHLETSNLLDYDDLLLRCVELLRLHSECVSAIDAVLIDEFQDTNHVQFELMTLFASARKRITTVGDPDQSIYGWRSAEITNLGKMQRLFPETLVVHLEDNYRSSGSILLAALEVIEQDNSRPQKPLLPTHCPGSIPALRRLPHAAAEGQWIVSEIKRCMSLTGNQLLTYSDFAILLRSASLSRQIESAMGSIGMPYRMVGGSRFFDRIEIKILLDYLRVIFLPDNTEALARVVNIPSRRIGDTTIKGLLGEASSKSQTLWTVMQSTIQGDSKPRTKITSSAEKGLSAFFNIIMTARKKMLSAENFWSPKDILHHIIDKIDFKTYLKQHHPEDNETRLANVEELVAQASNPQDTSKLLLDEANEEVLPPTEDIEPPAFETGETHLSRFLENVALSTELQRDDEVDEEGREQPRVTISTIHAAKGLEWPIVFIPAVYQGSIPHSRAEDSDEERRLLYVAMTRAQALLYLSCPKRNSTGEETTLSPFVSTQQVGAYLTDQGPTIQHQTVSDMCRILKRTCPSQEVLLDGYRDAENPEDTLWPLDGEENPNTLESRWNSASSSTYPDVGQTHGYQSTYLASSRKSGPSSASYGSTHKTTMQGLTAAPHPGGFVSATTQLQQTSVHPQRSQSTPSFTPSSSGITKRPPTNASGTNTSSASSNRPFKPLRPMNLNTAPRLPSNPTGTTISSTSSALHEEPTHIVAKSSASLTTAYKLTRPKDVTIPTLAPSHTSMTQHDSESPTHPTHHVDTPAKGNPTPNLTSAARQPSAPPPKRQKTKKLPANQGTLSAFFKPALKSSLSEGDASRPP